MANRIITRRGRKRTLVEEANPSLGTQEADKRKKPRKETGVSAEPIGNDGFQLLAGELKEVLKRLSALESATASTQGSSTSSSGHYAVNTLGQDTAATGSDSYERRANNVYVIQPTIEKPNFNGKGDHNPMRFLKRLKRYINSIGAQDRAIDIATDCLSGPALKILELNSKSWVTIEDFETDFRRSYWGDQHQEAARHRLMSTTFDASRKLTMCEHFADQVDTVSSLTIPWSERDIVNCVMRHYPTDVQQLWFTRVGEVTMLTASEFLRNLEQNVLHRTPTGMIGHSNSGGYNDRGRSNNRRGSNYIRGNARAASIEATPNYFNYGSARGRGRGFGRGRGRAIMRGGYNGRSFPAIKWEAASTSRASGNGPTLNNVANSRLSQSTPSEVGQGNGVQSNK